MTVVCGLGVMLLVFGLSLYKTKDERKKEKKN